MSLEETRWTQIVDDHDFLDSRPDRTVLFECRHCGYKWDQPTAWCRTCGSIEIAQYEFRTEN